MKSLLVLLAGILSLGALPIHAADAQGTAEDPHEQLRQILKQPMYQEWRLRQEGHLRDTSVKISPGLLEWLKRPFRAIGDFIEWLFRSHRSTPSALAAAGNALPTILKWAGIVVLLIAVAFVVILVARTFSRSGETGPPARILSREHVQQALESGNALALETGQWLDEASQLAAEKNFRAVYRALYLALLSGLHQAGKIEHNRNRTNWIYVRQFRGPEQERRTFGELTDLFDRVWYGHHPPRDGGQLDQLRRKVASLTGMRGVA